MRFGFVLPNNWGLEDPQDVLDVAVTAEQMGFDSVWVNHHVLNVGYVLDRLDNRPYYDTLTVLTYVAARTKTVRLGTSVLVLPYLNPVVLAKSLATLDVLSGGRLTVGVGVGALKQESDVLGADFNRRGAYTDESLRIMKALWTQPDPSHRGDFYSFSGVKFSREAGAETPSADMGRGQLPGGAASRRPAGRWLAPNRALAGRDVPQRRIPESTPRRGGAGPVGYRAFGPPRAGCPQPRRDRCARSHDGHT